MPGPVRGADGAVGSRRSGLAGRGSDVGEPWVANVCAVNGTANDHRDPPGYGKGAGGTDTVGNASSAPSCGTSASPARMSILSRGCARARNMCGVRADFEDQFVGELGLVDTFRFVQGGAEEVLVTGLGIGWI